MAIDLRDFESIDDIVAQLLAREIAFGFETARSFGYKMPAEYDVGFQRIAISMFKGSKGERCRYRLRVNDVTYDVEVFVPYLNGRISLAEVNALWEAAMVDLINAARAMANIWIDKHPEAQLKGTDAKKALAILSTVQKDDESIEHWMQLARDKARQAKFTRVR